jgi:ABC-type sugar transport system permease subunit
MVLLYSFYNQKNMFAPLAPVGLKNFVTIFSEPRYYTALLNTALIAVFTIGISIVLGLFIAVLMSAKIKGTTVYRTVYYIPVVVSMAIVSQIVNVWLSPTSGTLNNLLKTNVMWYDSTFWMFFWLITICVWKGMGATVILYIAGLASISPDIYEAAEIDGAGKAGKFFRITLPLLRPMHIFILITSIIGAFNIFEPVQLITRGGPNGATKVILFQIYDEAFKNGNKGMGSALSVVVLLILMALTMINLKAGEERGDGAAQRKIPKGAAE